MRLPLALFVVLLARRRTSGQPRAARMRALSLLLRRAAVAGPSVPAETSALGSRARVFFPTCPQRTSLYEDSSGAAVATVCFRHIK